MTRRPERPPNVRVMIKSLVALTLLLAALAPLGAEAAPPVALRDGRLSVDVTDMPWPAFLQELRKRTGIAVELRGSPSGSVTASFERLEIPSALRRLFGENASFVFFYDAGPDRPGSPPSTIWVMSGGPERPAPTEGTSSPSAATAEGADQAAARQEALESLGQQETNATTLATLSKALTTDPDPEVRVTAARVLARIGSPEALAVFRGVFADPEASVRMRAVDELLGVRGAPAKAILRDALNDPDEAVRAAAAAALEDLNQDGT